MPLTKLGIRGLRAFEDKRGYCPRWPNSKGPNHEAKPWQPAAAAAATAAASPAPAQHGPRKPDERDLLVYVSIQQV